MQECWYALALCLMSQMYITPEKAFNCLADGAVPVRDRGQSAITEADIEDMVKLRKDKLTYNQLGEIYGLDKGTVYKHIKRYLERRGLQ